MSAAPAIAELDKRSRRERPLGPDAWSWSHSCFIASSSNELVARRRRRERERVALDLGGEAPERHHVRVHLGDVRGREATSGEDLARALGRLALRDAAEERRHVDRPADDASVEQARREAPP